MCQILAISSVEWFQCLASPIPWASWARSCATSSPSLRITTRINLYQPCRVLDLNSQTQRLIQIRLSYYQLPRNGDILLEVFVFIPWLLSPKTPHSSRSSWSNRSKTSGPKVGRNHCNAKHAILHQIFMKRWHFQDVSTLDFWQQLTVHES